MSSFDYDNIKENTSSKIKEINDVIKRIKSYTPKVAIFGDSGVGKSSLCNALFGKDVAKISDVEACTREPQEIFIGDKNSGGIHLIDVPGVGEDPKRHKEYTELYKSLLPSLDLIIWAIKADDRKYATAMDVYETILKPNLENCPVVFAITQVEKIEPFGKWNDENNEPDEKQVINLDKKQIDISERFDISISKIVPISSHKKYNLQMLVSRVVEVLPNEKKSSFTREAKEENITEETYIKAEKGIFDYIKERFDDVWDSVKGDVTDIIVENAPKLIKKGLGWIKKMWF